MFSCFDFVQLWESKFFFLTYLLGRLFHKAVSPLLFLILGKLQIRAIFFFAPVENFVVLFHCCLGHILKNRTTDRLLFLSVSTLRNEEKYKSDWENGI